MVPSVTSTEYYDAAVFFFLWCLSVSISFLLAFCLLCAVCATNRPPLRQVNSNGDTLHSEIQGTLKMKTHLSGMPELKLGLNDKLLFESTGRRVLSAAIG